MSPTVTLKGALEAITIAFYITGSFFFFFLIKRQPPENQGETVSRSERLITA